MATPFTFGLDDPAQMNTWKKTVEGDYVPTPELKRPGKKPARPDESLPRVEKCLKMTQSDIQNIRERFVILCLSKDLRVFTLFYVKSCINMKSSSKS